ncbi:MAG: hypothetical protein O9264_17865 [Leptospira sp.]|nr:hypothetical protein [Leptospira sp.]
MKTTYTMKRFQNIDSAHILVEVNKTGNFLCKFDESKATLEKSSLPMDASKMRTIVAKSANAGAEICGICVGKLYS